MEYEKCNVVVIQEKIPKYRVPLFRSLGETSEIDLLVLHSQDRNLEFGINASFVKKVSLSKMYIQLGLWNHCRYADVIVVMFDIRWLTNIVIALLFRKKILLWGHGYGKNKLGNILRTILVKSSRALILYENDEVEKFVANGVSKDKLFYAGNTVAVNNHGYKDTYKTQFLYVGRLQKRKKIDSLLRAFDLIKKKLPEDIGITILGDGDIKEDLTLLAHKLDMVDRVRFLSAVYDEDSLKEVFSNAIAYVSPGHVGLGVLHSFAYGVPVITQHSNCHAPEVNNIKNGVNGFILNNSIDELSDMLLRLYRDNGLQSLLRHNAYDYYKRNRTMVHMVGRFKEAIEYVCTSNRAS